MTNKVHAASALGEALCGQTNRDAEWDVSITPTEADVTCLRCKALLDNRTMPPEDSRNLIANATWSVRSLDAKGAMEPGYIMTTGQMEGFLRMMAVSGWSPDQHGVVVKLLAEQP